jgi:hypothetical protein
LSAGALKACGPAIQWSEPGATNGIEGAVRSGDLSERLDINREVETISALVYGLAVGAVPRPRLPASQLVSIVDTFLWRLADCQLES